MRKTKMMLVALMVLILSACATADVKQTSNAIQAAPDFTLLDQDGKLWKLSDAVKDYRAVVLAFYPKDDTKL